MCIFFCKQKSADEMRIIDWSSDVCSSDLVVAITDAVRAAVPIAHPAEPDLGYLYGTILTDDVALGAGDGRASYNLCIFAEGQIDRSPTGSGVTARFALAAARGEIGPGDSCEIRGVAGEGFVGPLWAAAGGGGQRVPRVKVEIGRGGGRERGGR